MERIVSKFGGSSVADANQFRKVRDIVLADQRRQVVVVSAPGKRRADEAKLTDLLYLCADMAATGTCFAEPFALIRDRFVGIATDLGLSSAIAEEVAAFGDALKKGCSRDFAASRGEFFSAKLMAQYLEADFVDPADYITILPNGNVDSRSYAVLGDRLAATDRRYVIAGFYGQDIHGEVKTFSRGGSDISGAIAARAAKAALYENWTDTSGMLMADPRIVSNPKPIEEISFREVREMSYMGASVFHDEAILPVREAGIPICIKNTNRPQDAGTRIVPSLSAETIANTEIAGVSGKKAFTMICLEKTLMNKVVGFTHQLLGIFAHYGVSVEHFPSSIDSINVIVENAQLQDRDEEILAEIRKQLEPDSLTIEKDLALVAVVGEGMSHAIGVAAKVFAALRDAGVNVRVINQGASEINLIIGVASKDYEKALQAIYNAFVR
ncbi:MAG: aspartate kinase [Hahellaceae bacterium]|nr:aspartate kinase [Hahellaceae bacterium]